MSPNEYRVLAYAYAKRQPKREALVNWALGLCGESGEVAEVIKKATFHGKPLEIGAVKSELGDVLWYVAAICTELGLDLGEVMISNLEKLNCRHGSDGFKAHSQQRRD